MVNKVNPKPKTRTASSSQRRYCSTQQYRLFDYVNGLFEGNKEFNKPINNWNTKNVTDMSRMFHGAAAFQSVEDLDTSKVVNMSYMCSGATAFNQ